MNIIDFLPFSVLAPLIVAPLCALLPGRTFPWLIAFLSVAVSAAISAWLLSAAWSTSLSYHFGDWPPPFGIEYRVDAVNALLAVLISGIAVFLLPWARTSVNHEIPERQGPFYALFLLAFSGLMGISLTGDAFNVFVFLEISSLSTYALIAHGWDRRALKAAFRYLIMGTVGATFFLIGIGFLYAMTGTLNMADLAERLPQVRDSNAVHAALAFIVVGLGLKLAIFPLHLWLPNAYAFAPNFITAFVAATATKVALYVMLRFIFTVFSPEFSFTAVPLAAVLMALAIAGMVAGSWVAMFEGNLKRMLAYSSVAQVGYMVLGISLVTAAGVAAGILHLFNHALMKAALFAAMGTIYYQIGSVRLAEIAGMGRYMPWTFTAFALAGLSLIGVPLTAGFTSKWYLVIAALDAGQPWLIAVIMFASLLAIYYIWRVVEAAWFREPPEGAALPDEAPLSLLVPLWVLVALNFYFGLDTRLNVGGAEAAARALMGGAP